jgi:hypothetical protein
MEELSGVVAMTVLKNCYCSMPSIIFTKEFSFVHFCRKGQECLAEKFEQFCFIHKLCNTSVIKWM